MTTETQPRTQQEQPDDSNSVWRVLGGLEANQQSMLDRMDKQEQAMLERMGALSARMDRQEQTMLQRLDRQDANIAELGEKVAALEANQQSMLDRMYRLEAKMDRLLFVFIGVGAAIALTMLGAMAAGFWAVLAALAN